MSEETKEAGIRGALAIPEPDEENELIIQREQFAVTDFKSASWVANRIKAARQYAESVMSWAKQEERKAKQAEAFYMSTYGPQLKQLAQETLADVKKKYLDLPGARLQLRKQPVKLVVQDESELHQWASLRHPSVLTATITITVPLTNVELIEKIDSFAGVNGVGALEGTNKDISFKLDKTLLNNYFKISGEIPPGCTVEGGDDEVYIQ